MCTVGRSVGRSPTLFAYPILVVLLARLRLSTKQNDDVLPI